MSAEIPATARSQMGPFAIVPVWAMSWKMTAGEFRIYTVYRSFCDTSGVCFPKTRVVAERAQCSVSAVRNALQKFRRENLVTTKDVWRDGKEGKELAYLICTFADLDPRQWDVKPREGAEGVSLTQVTPLPGTSDTPSLTPVTQEQTSEHTKEQTISGIEASFDGLRLASEAASTLPRRGRTKKPTTIRDPKVRNVAADTALAKQIAEEYVYTDENLDVAVDYLWQYGNASTAAGCVRERADRANGEEAMAELFTLSVEWATGLDAAREYAVEYFGSRDIPGPWVGRLADRVRDALAIRTPNQALNAAINAVIDGAYQDPGRVLGAIDEVIRVRESERKAERIDRVRKQQEAKVAA